MPLNRPVIESFLSFVMHETNSGCWLWLGHISKGGYGAFGRVKGTKFAHRASWILHRGPIPDGLVVCHKCDVRCCVNPQHLWLGTLADNAADCVAKGRETRGERQGSSKLTDAVADSIFRDSRPHRDIAAHYGIAKATVSAIKGGTAWKHVTGGAVDRRPIGRRPFQRAAP